MSTVSGTLLDSLVFIESDSLDPDQLTNAIGLTPVVAERPGRVETDVDGAPLDPLPGQWIARTAHHLRSVVVDEHLRFLFSRLEPHRTMLRAHAASPRGRVLIGLEIQPHSEGSLGSRLDRELVRAIREIGADVWEFFPGYMPGGTAHR